ncbi:PREDICTED: F-box/WD repeat-containing protein 4 isoform X2 [Cyphomyrmex costatus]|nr:PREDICTED: F-box/WD repeat-containing protein 4 isoform X2 [Cyphomyrmex costatus]XP_018407751.1 PREDICTED: F-box/WD repeat-containing protein 4 isoform X2 [Cyphomyrmex costatus]
MTDASCRLDLLPSEVLLLIFDYCNEYDLTRLSEVCKRFYEIIHSDIAWTKKSKTFLVTNQISERFRKRCNTLLHPRAAWSVSYNWHYGIYSKENVFSRNDKNLMPWLRMTNNVLWWSGTGYGLYGFKRHERTPFEYSSTNKFTFSFYYNVSLYSGADISKFIVWNNFIICGYTDGAIIYFMTNLKKRKSATMLWPKSFLSCVNAIDATPKNVIVGSERGEVKMFRHPGIVNVPTWDYSDVSNTDVSNTEVTTKTKVTDRYTKEICNINLVDKVQSLSVDPTGVRFAVGSSGITDVPLHVINVERYTMVDKIQHDWKYGAGILDMVWDDPNTLLTCGYDTYIRKWDMRTGRCVCSWVDPYDATLYCIASDYRYTMITGTQYNCLAVLWDQRKSDFVQLYYVNSKESSRRSPIYSVQFDNTQLYCATDRHMIELDFSVHSYRKRDYKSLFIPCTR